ncbi:MAG: glycosyltransferase family 2 protein, partial [Pseudomonadota bacterium]
MEPKVSIVIPTYNREKIITKALDSVFGQTCQDFEVVILDDGSTDCTRDVVAKYGEKVKYFYQKNKGIAGGRNGGMKKTIGKHIAFLDSDDFWKPEKLERQLSLFSEHPE